MKPDGKIYQSAISMANQLVGCQPDEIFFTDDKPENVAAAIEAGMNAKLFESAALLNLQLRESGVSFNT
jgi:FMN phosphatase YigB (HAD superfamily)